jgi:flagellar basal-body rod protein FlgG
MLSGLYASASGMLTQQQRYDALATDLANVSTNGYRRQVTATRAVDRVLQQQMANAPDNLLASKGRFLPKLLQAISTVDEAPGAIRATGNLTDFALRGPGYFCIQTPYGEVYTRDGSFTLNAQHQLVTENGDLVLGERGPVTVNGAEWEVTPKGEILVDGTLTDKFKLVDLPNLQGAQRVGRNLWAAPETRPAASTEIAQRHLEGANVNALSTMAELIANTRLYEANQRSLQAQDSTLERAVNDIGRV